LYGEYVEKEKKKGKKKRQKYNHLGRGLGRGSGFVSENSTVGKFRDDLS